VFCRSRLEHQEKVMRVILQKTQSRRQGRECYEAIPPRSSCRQDQLLCLFLVRLDGDHRTFERRQIHLHMPRGGNHSNPIQSRST